MLDLNDLRLFALIVENGGIVRASRALDLPRSTVSRRLSALEASLKATLVERGCETFTLTERGKAILRYCRDVSAVWNATEEFLREADTGISGTVRLSLSSLLRGVFPELAAGIARQHPGIRLDVEIADRSDDQAGEGYDILLRAHRGQLRDSALRQRRIALHPMRAVAHPTLVRQKGLPFCPEALVHFDLVAFDTAGQWSDLDFVSNTGEAQAVRHHPRIRSGNLDLLVETVLAGNGVGILPDCACMPRLANGELVDVLPGWQASPLTISLLSPPVGYPGAAVRTVATMVETMARERFGQRAGGARQQRFTGVAKTERPVADLPPVSTDRTSYTAPTVQRYFEPRQDFARLKIDTEGDILMNPILKAAGAAILGAASLLSMPAHADDTPGAVVLYTNDFENVLQERFRADTGRDVEVIQMSGGELLARIAAEAANPQWDAVIFNGSNALFALDQQEQLKRMVQPRNLANLNEIGKSQLPENRSWFPIGMAASCVMTYRTDLVQTPPARFEDLATEAFAGKVGMADPAVAAPAYPCVAQLFHAMGEEKARKMFSGYFDNGMRVFRTNGPVGRALASGDISVALLTSQVAYTLKAGGTPVEIVWPKEGAPASVRGVGVQAKTRRPEAAQAFVEWLLEPATQTYLQDSAGPDGLFEPTVTGAGRRADGPPDGLPYSVVPADFAAGNEEAIKTWFADQAVR